MARYDYMCRSCEKIIELSHGMNEKPQLPKCDCGEEEYDKLISTGISAIVKGTQHPCRGESKPKREVKLGPKLGATQYDPVWRSENFEKLKRKNIKDTKKYIATGETK